MRVTLLLIAVIVAKAACVEQLDVAFVADGSETICGSNVACEAWTDLLEFYKDLAANWDIGAEKTQVAFATFGSNATVNWYLNTYNTNTSLKNAIDGAVYCGGELMVNGLVKTAVADIFSAGKGARENATRIDIMVTDGAPYISTTTNGTASRSVPGLTVLVVGVQGTPGNCTEDFAKSFSSLPRQLGKTYFMVDSYASLGGILSDLLDVIRAIQGGN